MCSVDIALCIINKYRQQLSIVIIASRVSSFQYCKIELCKTNKNVRPIEPFFIFVCFGKLHNVASCLCTVLFCKVTVERSYSFLMVLTSRTSRMY